MCVWSGLYNGIQKGCVCTYLGSDEFFLCGRSIHKCRTADFNLTLHLTLNSVYLKSVIYLTTTGRRNSLGISDESELLRKLARIHWSQRNGPKIELRATVAKCRPTFTLSIPNSKSFHLISPDSKNQCELGGCF